MEMGLKENNVKRVQLRRTTYMGIGEAVYPLKTFLIKYLSVGAAF